MANLGPGVDETWANNTLVIVRGASEESLVQLRDRAERTAAQGRPPLSTLEQLGLFASCDLDSSQDIDFNEWCGVFPLLAALLEKQQRASTAARSRAAIAASAAVTSSDGGGKVLVGAGEAGPGAAAALQLKLTGSGPAVRTE